MKKIKNIRNILIGVAILLVCLIIVRTKVVAANKAQVIVETANLRNKPSSDSLPPQDSFHNHLQL